MSENKNIYRSKLTKYHFYYFSYKSKLMSHCIYLCIGSFTLDWNLSKSAQNLSWLILHIKTMFQSKTKTKPRKIFATLSRHFSLTKFCQVSYITEKQTSKEHKITVTRKEIVWIHGPFS